MASYFNTSRNIEIKWSPYSDEDFALVDSSILFYHIFSYDGSCMLSFFYFSLFSSLVSLVFYNEAKNRHETNLYLSDHSYAKLFGSIDSFPKPKVNHKTHSQLCYSLFLMFCTFQNVAWYPGSDSDFFVFGLHELGEDQIKIVRWD